jgi:hypothetical protein
VSKHDSSLPLDGCCGDAAVYLLGGMLDEQQADAFLAHSRFCSVCSDELDALAPAVDQLSVAVPQLRAPEHVKAHVMAVVRGEAQSREASVPASRPGGVRGWLVPRRRALALASAALLAAGLAIGGLSTPFGASPSGGRAVERGTARTFSADVTLAGASATLHERAGHTWLTVAMLPQPASGHVYEVWVKRPGQQLPQPTNSLFSPTDSGVATVDVPETSGATEVLVTEEPDGGSALPTSSPVIVAHLD